MKALFFFAILLTTAYGKAQNIQASPARNASQASNATGTSTVQGNQLSMSKVPSSSAPIVAQPTDTTGHVSMQRTAVPVSPHRRTQ